MRKRVINTLLAALMVLALCLTGCTSGGDTAEKPSAGDQSGTQSSDNSNKQSDTGSQTGTQNEAGNQDANKADNDQNNTETKTDSNSDNNTDSSADNTSVDDDGSDDSLVTKEGITGSYKKKDLKTTYNENKATAIVLNGDSATITGTGAEVDGLTIRINTKGNYLISGTLNDGQIVVNVGDDDDVRLILNGVDIKCSNSSCIYVINADKCIITTTAGSVNNLTDGNKYTYAKPDKEEPNAAIFTDCDLSINGEGTLNVTGNFGHAIRAKADLKITSGTIKVSAADKGFKAKKTFSILDGNVTINAKKDGIDAGSVINIDGGSLTVTAGDDAVQSDEQIIVNDGTVDLSKSKKGMKAPVITTNGGNILLAE